MSMISARSSIAVSRTSLNRTRSISAQGPGTPDSGAACHSRSADVKGTCRGTQVARRPAASRVKVPGEHLHVQLARFQPKRIPRPGGQQELPGRPAGPVRLQHAAQPGHANMQRVHRARRRIFAPDAIDELAAGDRLVRPQREQPKHRLALRPARLQFTVTPPGPYRAEQTDQ